jgi:hypothetical protein
VEELRVAEQMVLGRGQLASVVGMGCTLLVSAE